MSDAPAPLPTAVIVVHNDDPSVGHAVDGGLHDCPCNPDVIYVLPEEDR